MVPGEFWKSREYMTMAVKKIEKMSVLRTVIRNTVRWIGLFRGDTLSRRILGGVLPAVLAVVLSMGIFSYYMVRQQILSGVQKEMNTLAQNAAMGLQAFFEQR